MKRQVTSSGISSSAALQSPSRPIRTGASVLGITLGLEVLMIGLAFAWVAIHSYLIDPGHEAAHYEAYAQRASPIVSLVLGMPVFFALAHCLARRYGRRGARLALAASIVYAILDIALVATFAEDLANNLAFAGIATSTKLLAAYLGGRIGARATVAGS